MILDTSFILDLMGADEQAIDRYHKFSERNEAVRVCALTIFELWTGIACSSNPDAEKAKVTSALSQFDVIKLSRQSAEKAGEINGALIRAGSRIDPEDAMIAGIALLENETVLTRNVRHFSCVKGLRVESY